MVFYLPGNVQVFNEDMALWVALVHDTHEKVLQY